MPRTLDDIGFRGCYVEIFAIKYCQYIIIVGVVAGGIGHACSFRVLRGQNINVLE